MWYNNINWYFFAAINCAVGLVFFVAMFSPWWALFWVPAGMIAGYHGVKTSNRWTAEQLACPYCNRGWTMRAAEDGYSYLRLCPVCGGTGVKHP